jgi:hypothetical protein
MKVTVALEVGDRVVVEQAVLPDTRQGWRSAISNIACQVELSTFGPPGPVEAMTLEDGPVRFNA